MLKKFFLILLILAVVVGIVRLLSGEDDWICANGVWIKHGRPSAPQPTTLCPGAPKEVGMKLTSPAFGDGQTLPAKYTCDGAQISPPLTIVEVPEAAKSLVLILNDPDAPLGTFNHWLVWNLDPKIITLEEGKLPVGVVVGTNSAGVQNYTSPCPPSGEHRYIFKLYALDSVPNLSSVSRESAVMAALDKHVLAETTLTGKYSRK